MTQSEYEERRRQLDAQLRAEVELLYQACLVRLRGLETLQLGGGHPAGAPRCGHDRAPVQRLWAGLAFL